MVKVRIGVLLLVSISSLAAISVNAQSSEHQRIGVERKTGWELGFELGGGMKHKAYDAVDYFFVDSYASIDALLSRKWTASLYIPLSCRLIIGQDVKKLFMTGLGDIELSAGWTGRIADTRVSASLRASAPTGQWSDYASAEGFLAPGYGRWTIGGALSASRILDPVVLGAAFSYDVGLPRADRFSTTWRPGDMSLSLSVTEVLNDAVGYTLKATQNAELPEISRGAYSMDSFAYAASASIELWYSDGDASARFGIAKSITDPYEPARLYAALAYTLRSEKKDE